MNNNRKLFYHFFYSLQGSSLTITPFCPVVAGLSSEPLKVQSGKILTTFLGPSSQRQLIATTYIRAEIKILLKVMCPEKKSKLEEPKVGWEETVPISSILPSPGPPSLPTL